MPTIDDLPQATSVSDTDELVVSQNDIARKATRAQMLSGVQAALALPENSLLGRLSSGTGGPETITIGANLTCDSGTLSAPAPFLIGTLPGAGPPRASDLVAVAQGGENAAQNYAAFMGGLSSLTGISGSSLLAAPSGGVGSRPIAEILADAISIESFGAVGDGATDDTAAFIAALQASRPIRLDGRVYVVNGPLLISEPTTWIGVLNETILLRLQVTSRQRWIECAGSSFCATGIIFNSNGLAAADAPSVQIDNTCTNTRFMGCQFLNATGSTAGHGLLVTCGTNASHEIYGCKFGNNQLNGFSAYGGGSVSVQGCSAQNNSGSGIAVDAATGCLLGNNVCNANAIGIAVGAWQSCAGNATPSPACLIYDNFCSGNATWGLAASGNYAAIRNNSLFSNGILGTGGGALVRVGMSRCAGNQISGGTVGLDARTSWGTLIAANHVTSTTTGMLLGGCQNISVSENFLSLNQWAIDISAIEPSISYGLTGPVSIVGNWIGFTLAFGGGVYARDGCLGLSILNNDFNGWGSAVINQALWLHTDQAIVASNRWNNQPVISIQSGVVGSISTLVFPDISDQVLVTSTANPISSLLTNHQADTLGQINLIRVTNGGAGYTSARVVISGGGSGAAAEAVVDNGRVLWIIVTSPGSGYGSMGSVAEVTITGDGVGAAANAYVGLPVLNGRRLRLSCNCTVQLALAGASPPQQNWTGYTATIPAFGAIELEGVFGAWRAVSFPATDYLLPTGDGGAVLQSVAGGAITLRPSAGGVLQLASATEAIGCTSTVGRGPPAGLVEAPPGSDFRNLNGGVGSTLWVKQAGTDANGWVAVA